MYQKPSVGRIVLYTFDAPFEGSFSSDEGQTQTVPAIVVNAWYDRLTLRVFTDGAKAPPTLQWVPHKSEVADPRGGNYWDWPPRS